MVQVCKFVDEVYMHWYKEKVQQGVTSDDEISLCHLTWQHSRSQWQQQRHESQLDSKMHAALEFVLLTQLQDRLAINGENSQTESRLFMEHGWSWYVDAARAFFPRAVRSNGNIWEATAKRLSDSAACKAVCPLSTSCHLWAISSRVQIGVLEGGVSHYK